MKTIYEMINKKKLNESNTINVNGDEILKSDITKIFGKIFLPKNDNTAAVEKINISSESDLQTFYVIWGAYYQNKYFNVKTNVILKNTKFHGEGLNIMVQCKNKIIITNTEYVSLILSNSNNCNISIKDSYDMTITGDVFSIDAVNSGDINLDGKIGSINFNKSSGNLYDDSGKCSIGKIILKNDSQLTNDDSVEVGSKDVDDSSKYYEDMNYSD